MPSIKCLIFFLILGQLSCQQNPSSSSTTSASTDQKFVPDPPSPEEFKALVANVHALKSTSQKRQFLLNIYKKDQQFRTEETAVQTQFGYESPEHKEAQKNMWDMDERNLIQVEAYIEKFGYPTKKDVGETAVDAPCLVIHHANGKEIRERYFPYLYQAYQNGDLGGRFFAMYLNRFYTIEFGERMEMKSPFREEDEITKLIEALNLPRTTSLE